MGFADVVPARCTRPTGLITRRPAGRAARRPAFTEGDRIIERKDVAMRAGRKPRRGTVQAAEQWSLSARALRVRWDESVGSWGPDPHIGFVRPEDVVLAGPLGKLPPAPERDFPCLRGSILTLPEGEPGVPLSSRQLRVTKIGKGHASVAYHAEDGLVYVFSSPLARDPAKDVLVAARRRRASPHLPAVEYLGQTRTGWQLYRMPWYAEVSGAAAEQRKVLERCLVQAWKGAWAPKLLASREHLLGMQYPYQRVQEALSSFGACVRVEVRAGRLPNSLLAAIELLLQTGADNFGGDWMLEFPRRNVRQDARGRLILLDVIFDQQKLKQAWGRRTRPPPIC